MCSDISYKDIVLYKTENCRNWNEMGFCRYGKRCRYAHGQAELRPILRSNQYKTKSCKAYHEHGTCSYGVRCTFIHHPEDSNHIKPSDLCCLPFEETIRKRYISQKSTNNNSNNSNGSAACFISKNIWDSVIGLSSYEPDSNSSCQYLQS